MSIFRFEYNKKYCQFTLDGVKQPRFFAQFLCITLISYESMLWLHKKFNFEQNRKGNKITFKNNKLYSINGTFFELDGIENDVWISDIKKSKIVNKPTLEIQTSKNKVTLPIYERDDSVYGQHRQSFNRLKIKNVIMEIDDVKFSFKATMLEHINWLLMTGQIHEWCNNEKMNLVMIDDKSLISYNSRLSTNYEDIYFYGTGIKINIRIVKKGVYYIVNSYKGERFH